MSTKSDDCLVTTGPATIVAPKLQRTSVVSPSFMWAELSLREAREMAAEAMRIVAETKDVCRRSKRSRDV